MTYQEMKRVLVDCVDIRTIKQHKWNYISEKIKILWEEFEYCCNEWIVTPFWLWQFDELDQQRLLSLQPQHVQDDLINAHKGAYKIFITD